MPSIRPATAFRWTDADTVTTAADEIVLGASGSVNLYESASNVLKTDDSLSVGGSEAQVNTLRAAQSTGRDIIISSASYIEFGGEITDPAAPAANGCRLYVRDTGAKTELVARFATGVIQQVAIEP